MESLKEYLYNLATDKEHGFLAGIFKFFLWLISLLYGLAVRVLIFFSRLSPYRLNCRVISVGNITLGGTGKTSLVEFIARELKQRGRKVAILSRGYAKQKTSGGAVADEPLMLELKLKDVPVLVDADRRRAAKLAISRHGADTVILDDGFQQWKIKKDLEIVTIDATGPFGNGCLIPRGILREPLSSLKRADIFILTKTNLEADAEVSASRRGTVAKRYIRDTVDLEAFLNRMNRAALIINAIHQPVAFRKLKTKEEIDLSLLKGKTVAVFCGIADPDSFENLILILGIKIGLSFKFPDHHHYTQKDLDEIIATAKEKNIDTIITTEKDAVKVCSLQLILRPALGPSSKDTESSRGATYDLQLLALRIALKITKNEENFISRLSGLSRP